MADTSSLTKLGSGHTEYPSGYDAGLLESFKNPHPEMDVWVKLNVVEFGSLCPITNQPDTAQFTIQYIPNKLMVESKSLKLYMFSFRNHGSFHEEITVTILKDLVDLLNPRYIEVLGRFLPRGGISIDPYVNYGISGTKWEKFAWKRLKEHEITPEYLTNRN